MNNTVKNTLLAIAILGASQAHAANTAIAPIELPDHTVDDIAAPPTPTYHPAPQVRTRLIGTKLTLRFTVSEKGRPKDVRLTKSLNEYGNVYEVSFASQMRDFVVTWWKFEPARNTAGEPVAVKVIMPVHVIKKGSEVAALVSLILDSGGEERS